MREVPPPRLPPIHREGWRFVAIFAAVSLVLYWIWTPLGVCGAALTLWCAFFFRDPSRVTPVRPGLIVSPADGVVQSIMEASPPAELGMGDGTRTCVSIFMDVFNVHVNRVPVEGVVRGLAYRKGKFINASLDKASVDNERQAIRIQIADGRDIAVVQIAGLIARRILCELDLGDHVRAGERFGMIRFGSRLDVYLPEGVGPMVCVGQTAIAGETVLADIDSPEGARAGERR